MADPRCAELTRAAAELGVLAEATGLAHQSMLADWMNHEARQAVYGWGMASDYAHRYAVAWRARRVEPPASPMIDAALAQVRAQLVEAEAMGAEIAGLNVEVLARGTIPDEMVVLDVVGPGGYGGVMTDNESNPEPETTEVSVETPAKDETSVEVDVQHAEGEVALDGSGNAPDPAQADAAAQEGDTE